MARNKLMKLWTAVVTAFLALCTTLGLITPTAAAAVPQPQPERNGSVEETLPEQPQGSWPRDRSLPPTMKQRIRAEAHGSSPSCRHRQAAAVAPPAVPLARSSLRPGSDAAAPPLEQTTRQRN
ncbi:DUF6344 domain-containing protein [Streptomyces nodosus]|uniref:DUF6344 domain-containing protein n=1 Tax=Streptomyces nodosus TaxID=40318 RepID=UPI00382D089C